MTNLFRLRESLAELEKALTALDIEFLIRDTFSTICPGDANSNIRESERKLSLAAWIVEMSDRSLNVG